MLLRLYNDLLLLPLLLLRNLVSRSIRLDHLSVMPVVVIIGRREAIIDSEYDAPGWTAPNTEKNFANLASILAISRKINYDHNEARAKNSGTDRDHNYNGCQRIFFRINRAAISKGSFLISPYAPLYIFPLWYSLANT